MTARQRIRLGPLAMALDQPALLDMADAVSSQAHSISPEATCLSIRQIISASIARLEEPLGALTFREPVCTGLLGIGERDREFLPLAISKSLHGIEQDTVIPN